MQYTTFHEVLANKRSRIKLNSRSEWAKDMVEDDRDARYYRMIEAIDDILLVAQDMAIYKLVVDLQHIFFKRERHWRRICHAA